MVDGRKVTERFIAVGLKAAEIYTKGQDDYVLLNYHNYIMHLKSRRETFVIRMNILLPCSQMSLSLTSSCTVQMVINVLIAIAVVNIRSSPLS